MATNLGDKCNGIVGLERPEFIVIKLDYSRKLVFPIEEGISFLKAYASAIHIKEEYNKPTHVARPEEVDVAFMTRMDLAALKLNEALES